MCFFDNWGNFSNWNNATVTVIPANQNAVDGAVVDPTGGVGISLGGSYGYGGEIDQVTFSVSGMGAGDTFFIDLESGGFTQVGSIVYFGDVAIANVTGGEGTPLVITPIHSSSVQVYQQYLIADLINAVRYVQDEAGEASSETITITVARYPGAPVVTNVSVNFVEGVSSPGLEFDLSGALEASGEVENIYAAPYGATQATIAALSDGGYVLAWVVNNGGDLEVMAQRFDAEGAPAGDAAVVNTFTTGSQQQVSVIGLADGGYVVTWISDGQDGDGSGIYGQRFDASGDPVGGEFRVNSSTTGTQLDPHTVALPDGGFVVFWTDFNASPPVSVGQWYDADGAPVGGERTLFAYSGSSAVGPAEFAVLEGGGFAAVAAHGNGTQGTWLYLFDAEGVAVGAPIQLTSSYSTTGRSVQALEGGGFVVAWVSGTALLVQVYDSSGVAAGPAVSVQTAGYVVPTGLSLTTGADGGFIVSWQDRASGNYDVLAQAFDSDGALVGPVVEVSSLSSTATSTGQSIVQLADGSVVAVWISQSDVLTRLLTVDGAALETTEDGHAIPISLSGWDGDGSETLTLTLSGFPEGATFNMGEAGPDGTWVIEVAYQSQLLGLRMTGLTDFVGEFQLTVATSNVEDAGGESTSSVTVTVEVSVNASTPTIDIIRDGGGVTTDGNASSFAGVDFHFASVALPDGGFVTVSVQSGTNHLLLQYFDQAGDPVGSPVTISSSASVKTTPSITAAPDGSLFIAWADSLIEGSSAGIAGVYVDPDGVAGAPVQVNTGVVNTQQYPDVVAMDGGGFLVVWASTALSGISGIFGQAYDADGVASGSEFVVGAPYTNDAYANYQSFYPSATLLEDGRILVVWQENRYNGANYDVGVRGQILEANGSPSGGEFVLQEQIGVNHLVPTVAAVASGGWVLTWNQGSSQHAQLYDADGGLVGDEFVADITSGSNHGHVTPLGDGGYVLTWYSGGAVRALRFDAQGEAVGSVITVPGTIGYGAPAVLADGDTLAFISFSGGAGQVVTYDVAYHGLTGHEDGAIAVPIQLTWPDTDGSETLTLTLSGFPEGSTFTQGEAGPGGTWIIEVSDPAELADLEMIAAPGFQGQFTLQASATTVESADSSSSTANFQTEVVVEAGASQPVLTGPVEPVTGDEDTGIGIPISLTWPDQDGSETMVVTLSGFPDGATFNLGEADGEDWVIEVTDPADLNALVMTPPLDWFGDFDLTVTAETTESANSATASDTIVIPVEIADVTDLPPEITAPATITATEDTAVALSGLSFADPDSATITVTLTVDAGALAAGGDTTGLTIGGDAVSMTISGAAATINAWLAAGGATWTPPANATADAELTVDASDGAQSDSQSVTLEVTPVNDGPEITGAPASISVTEDAATAITGVTVADVDSASLTVTLSVASGGLAATSGAGVTVGGSALALTLTGSAADINAFIAASNVSYLPASNADADVTLGVSVSDGDLSDSADVTLDLQPVNDAPEITAAPASIAVTEDTATAVTGITVADIDSASLTVTVTVASGGLTADTGGGVIVGGPGSFLTLTGSAADINAFIAAGNLVFTPAENSTADVDLDVSVSDGALADDASVTLDIAPVNDGPEITAAPASISVTEDAATAITGVTVADVDSASLTVTLSVASGGLAATSGAGVTVGGSALALTLTGSAADINAFIAASNVSYLPASNADADVTLGVSVSDGDLSDSADVTLDLQPVNDAPTLSAPVAGEVLENNASAITGISVGDIDSSSLTITIIATSGTLAALDGGGVTVSGSGTDEISLTGSGADLNAFIAAGQLTFLTEEDSEADVTLAVSVTDGEFVEDSEILLSVTPDSIDGGPGDDPLVGTSDDDTLRGFGGNDQIDGGAGDDIIEGGAGNDSLTGGEGNDTFVFRKGDGRDTIVDPQSGDTIVIYGFTSYTLVAVGAQLHIVLDEDNVIIITQRSGLPFGGMPQIVLAPDEQRGTEDDDELTGTGVFDDIEGLGGNDVLSGEGSNDVLDGGTGDDRLIGGAGNDQLIGGDGFDTADYSAAAGGITLDLRKTTAQDTGGAGVDTVSSIEGVIGSAFADNIIGSTVDDVLRGGAGADRLNGGQGDDELEGGDGDDVLNGGSGNDVLFGEFGADVLTGGKGNDVLNAGLDGSVDVYAYVAAAFGNDTINDFEDGFDLIQFNYAAVDDISDLIIADDGFGSTLITAPDGSTILLFAIDFNDIDAADFIFGP